MLGRLTYFVLHALNLHSLELFCDLFHVHHAFQAFLFVDPTSCNSRLKFSSYYTLSLREDVKVYQGQFYGQGPSPILGVQAKHITCITLTLTLVNVWLV